MKQKFGFRGLVFGLLMIALIGAALPINTFAEDEAHADSETSKEKIDEPQNAGTSISLMPVSKVLQIAPSSEYEDTMTVNNDGNDEIEIEVYAAPYSYVYSEDEKMYKLGFNVETNFTQITRWITFEKKDGSWDKRVVYKIPPHEALVVKYRISTPGSIPAGGQYAVIFAHTLTGVISASGIRTEASPGMLVFGRSSEGEINASAQISELKAQYGLYGPEAQDDMFYATAKVKNDGNIDFHATGEMKVEPIIGFSSYTTPENQGKVSVIPESELEVADRWADSPSFGIYKVTWTVKAGDKTEKIETIIFVNPLIAIIVTIMVLTIITIWTIMLVRRRRDRRSRLAV